MHEKDSAVASKVLVVDDTPDNLRLLTGVLSKHDYDVRVARDGDTALKYLAKERPDLILLDIMMPPPDGFEVCRRLKGDALLKEIPVIFLSAKSASEDIVKGFQLGAADYVTKPFRIPELLARVDTHVRLARTIARLQNALARIETLEGLLPICASCKKVRDAEGNWHQVEAYIRDRTRADFTHSICPKCFREWYPDFEYPKK